MSRRNKHPEKSAAGGWIIVVLGALGIAALTVVVVGVLMFGGVK